MPDRQLLLKQLLTYLESTPDLPEYLVQAPDSDTPFDPYQMVGEWIALRQEMKQQGKLLQAAQEQLQRELEAARSHNSQLQQQLLTAQQQSQPKPPTEATPDRSKEKESFLRNLLNVMDALDRACSHWQDQEMAMVPTTQPHANRGGLRYGLARWLARFSQRLAPEPVTAAPDVMEILQSDRQGIELIRLNLLDLLKQQQVTPILALGEPFNARYMYALGRQPNATPAGTVIQEVVRGYEWGDRILREAQVIVSAGMGTSA